MLNFCVLMDSSIHINPYPASMLMTSAANMQVHVRLTFNYTEANTMNPDQTAPKGSSLIWVHSICIIGYQSTFASSDKQADDICDLLFIRKQTL